MPSLPTSGASTGLEFTPAGPPLTELNSRQQLAARGIVIHGSLASATAPRTQTTT